MLHVRSFRAADCNPVNKDRTDFMYRFNLKKAEYKEQYRVEISNRFAVSENLDAEVDINCLGTYDSKLLAQRKQAKMQWQQHPSEINGDNFNNERPETKRHFRKKEGIYET
jgi:hypothetical protein